MDQVRLTPLPHFKEVHVTLGVSNFKQVLSVGIIMLVGVSLGLLGAIVPSWWIAC